MSVPLYEQIYDYIVEEVREGRLRPGEVVPSEKGLADQFGVSRITSKTALERLAIAGIVDRIKGRGTYVAKDAMGRLDASNVSVVAEHRDDFSPRSPAFRDDNVLVDPEATDRIPPRSTKNLCGLIIPDFSETFALGMVHSIERRCSELGVNLLLKRSYGAQQEEDEAIQTFMALGVDGLIIFPVHGELYNEQLLRLVLNRFPVVLIDRYLQGIPACSVYTDNQKAAEELTLQLFRLGHTHIAFMSPTPEKTSTIEDRLRGFMNAFLTRDTVFNPRHLLTRLQSTLPTLFSEPEPVQRDEEMIGQFFESNPEITAVVASEYNLALVIYETLIKLGKRVPEDVSIVCFDSAPHPFGSPLFTHVVQDEQTIGCLAVDSLVAQIHGELPLIQQIVPYRIVEGQFSRSLV